MLFLSSLWDHAGWCPKPALVVNGRLEGSMSALPFPFAPTEHFPDRNIIIHDQFRILVRDSLSYGIDKSKPGTFSSSIVLTKKGSIYKNHMTLKLHNWRTNGIKTRKKISHASHYYFKDHVISPRHIPTMVE